jgi:hypothetical protein
MFCKELRLLIEEYSKESGVNIPRSIDRKIMPDIILSAMYFLNSDFAGRLAVLFPKSWGITQQVRYNVLRRVEKERYGYDETYIEKEMYLAPQSSTFYGEEMECYASGDAPEVIFILEADKPTHEKNKFLHFCGLPYDDLANEGWENAKYTTTQVKEFNRLEYLVENTTNYKFILVHPAVSIDLMVTDVLADTPIKSRWLNRGFARNLSYKTTADGDLCVSNIGRKDGGQASVGGECGKACKCCGVLVALAGKTT